MTRGDMRTACENLTHAERATAPLHKKSTSFEVLFLIFKILLHDFAVAFTERASRIRFISIDVHCERKLGAYAAYNVTENEASAVGIDLDAYNVLIGNTASLCVCGSHMDVTLCNDNAAVDLNFACRTNELAGSGAFNVAAFTDGSCNAERSCVCERDLNLACRASRSEDRNLCDRLLGTYNVNSFLARVLTGLRKHLLNGELVALAEKDVDVFLREVDMTCGGFN